MRDRPSEDELKRDDMERSCGVNQQDDSHYTAIAESATETRSAFGARLEVMPCTNQWTRGGGWTTRSVEGRRWDLDLKLVPTGTCVRYDLAGSEQGDLSCTSVRFEILGAEGRSGWGVHHLVQLLRPGNLQPAPQTTTPNFLSTLPASSMKITPATGTADRSSRIATHSHMFVLSPPLR